MKDLKCVGGYIRVSTEEQSRKGLSLESQQEDIEEYCRKNGYRLVKLYIDRGISARKHLHKRAAFMEMMSDVKNKVINHIVVIRLDRFFRNVYDYHRMMHEFLEPADCGWSAVKEQYDTTTTNGRLMINLRLSIAEQEADTDSDRIKDVFANRIRAGYVVTGHTPMGYKIENKRLVKDENAVIIQDMFETYIRLSSVVKTMEYINQKYGIQLDNTTVARDLKKEIYTGKHRDNPNYCEPIISKEVFEAVQRLHPISVRNDSSGTNKYIFTGLLVCDHCGRKRTGIFTRGITYYRCNNYYQNKTCDEKYYIREDDIEKYLLENIEQLLKSYITEIKAKEKNAPAAKSNREQIEKKIRRLTDLYINGMIDIAELKARKTELEAQIVDVKGTVKVSLAAANSFLNSDFKKVYGSLSANEKRCLWRSVIRQINISGKQITSVSFL